MINIKVILKESEILIKNKSQVKIIGFIENIRDFGKLKFLDVIDSNSRIQVLIKNCKENFFLDDVYEFEGILKNSQDKKKIELLVESYKLISKSNGDQIKVFNENTKLSKRISYLRKLDVKKTFLLQSNFLYYTNMFFFERDFFQLHTPLLSFDASEGAKLFSTKSVNYDDFYLAQSPQIYKQSLMSAGFEKYFQISTCFRDENLRSDRQPEFTQLDFEISFVSREQIYKFVEEYISFILKKLNISIPFSFTYMSFSLAKEKYFSDSPDIRTKCSKKEINGKIYMQVENAENYDLNKIDNNNSFFIENNKILFLHLDEESTKNNFRDLSKCLKEDVLSFVWVYDMPLFEHKNNKLYSCQNPFSEIKEDDKKKINSDNLNDLLSIKTISYDLVLNGQEILGGSVRNTCKEEQMKIMTKLGTNLNKMNFFFNLFDDSFPKHAGAALGIERFLSVVLKKQNIREIIPFPKSHSGKCLFSSNM